MRKGDLFKYVYWLLTAAFVLFAGLIAARIGTTVLEGTRIPVKLLILITIPVIIIAGIFTAISVFVYRDAPQRGMDKWMWMTVAVFVPNLIGLIIYFIVRSGNNFKCIGCGKSIRSDYKVCPYCSTPLDVNCPRCGKQVLSSWKLCPYCKENLE